MDQPSLFPRRVVNVASVPHRSPFRYPGGKTWLVPRIRQWILSRPNIPTELVEPFCGGGIVGLTSAFELLADRVTMVELDDDLAAVWNTILERPEVATQLAEQIESFELSLENVRSVLDAQPSSEYEVAFRTILKNRVNRGGILAPGASLVKAGENGKGLHSRWYPQTLKRRILAISRLRSQISFIHGDGMEVMCNMAHRKDAVFFIDPPYTVAARRLYSHWEIDHEKLFELASNLAGDFLLTYGNDERIIKLAAKYDLDTRQVAMKNTHHAEVTELLIGRDLSWVDQPV